MLTRLTARDSAEAGRLEAADGDVGWSTAQFEKEAQLPFSYFLICRENECLIGFGGFWNVAQEAQLTNLVVARSKRRRGVAQEILERLITEAHAARCVRMTLEVRSRNAPARALYEKMGFVQTSTRAKAYTNPDDDAILMEKRL
jgi:ribosomal-protein-alanine acetyltransferase